MTWWQIVRNSVILHFNFTGFTVVCHSDSESCAHDLSTSRFQVHYRCVRSYWVLYHRVWVWTRYYADGDQKDVASDLVQGIRNQRCCCRGLQETLSQPFWFKSKVYNSSLLTLSILFWHFWKVVKKKWQCYTVVSLFIQPFLQLYVRWCLNIRAGKRNTKSTNVISILQLTRL